MLHCREDAVQQLSELSPVACASVARRSGRPPRVAVGVMAPDLTEGTAGLTTAAFVLVPAAAAAPSGVWDARWVGAF
jgi:hypothetical protein